MRRVSGATGALVLSTALLISGAGGAVAVADTGNGDSASRSSGSPDTGKGSASSATDSDAGDRESIRTTLRDVVRSATSALDSRQDRVFRPSREAEVDVDDLDEDDIDLADDLDIVDETDEVSDTVTEVPGEPEADDPVIPEAPAETEAETPADAEGEPDTSDSGAAAPPATGSSTGGSDSPSNSGSGSTSPYGPVSEEQTVASSSAIREVRPIFHVVRTMTTVVVTLGSAAATIPPVVFSLPFSQTPVSDVIALLEALLTSVGESATAVAKLPSDLAAMLGAGAVGPSPVLIGSHSDDRVAPLIVGSTPIAGPQPASPVLPMNFEPLPGNTVVLSGFGDFTPTALMAYSAPPQTVPAALSARMGEHQSLVDRAFSAMLLPLSLWALATGALPGLAGLLVVFGAGIRVGYRQAKAGFAVKVAGIARFARPGPMGVVRAGSMVALHHRGVRSAGPRALRLVRGDQAA